MKIYLAGKYSRKEELIGYAKELAELGHSVVSSWLWTSLDDPQAKEVEVATESVPQLAGEVFALWDMIDLYNADMLVSFTEPVRGENKDRGGRHVELGVALARGMMIIIVGPRENVFYCHPDVEAVATWEDAKKMLSQYI